MINFQHYLACKLKNVINTNILQMSFKCCFVGNVGILLPFNQHTI